MGNDTSVKVVYDCYEVPIERPYLRSATEPAVTAVKNTNVTEDETPAKQAIMQCSKEETLRQLVKVKEEVPKFERSLSRNLTERLGYSQLQKYWQWAGRCHSDRILGCTSTI